MKRTFIEKLLFIIAWAGLIGGILLSILYCNSILGSGAEMCVPTGLAYLAGGIFISVGCWAVLMEILALSDRITRLENAKEE
jgi:hypothetical protein